MKRILGIDPGLYKTGYGILEGSAALDWGCICPPKTSTLSQRLAIIHQSLSKLIDDYQITTLAIEKQFIGINKSAILNLGMVRGICLLLAAQKSLEVEEFTPSKVKKAATGKGNASKAQIQYYMSKRLNISQEQLPEDAADALALALCLTPQLNLKASL